MGWVWSDDNDDDDSQRNISSGSDEHSSTRKIVKSQCRTEEVEPGKFLRKCEKTEELLRTCAGRPVEVLQSNKEYTEEDITNEVLRARSTTSGSSNSSPDHGVFFPGLRNDIENMERSFFFGGISRLFEAAEEMKNGLFDVIAKAESSSSSPTRRGIPIEEYGRQETRPRSMDMDSGDTDFTGLAKDV
ncbi:unnamed protein product [Lathyrus oleraceus]|uniref:Mal d 1-associated protein n=1 Tax=Pisum sativum TaxID=3888 RepID=A0A9D5AZY9_PEA|nr:fra a 1-associated protein [Pisum sativum]KAI5425256.1 hypothetical protein KIW84_031163 [Pisum sativum]